MVEFVELLHRLFTLRIFSSTVYDFFARLFTFSSLMPAFFIDLE